MLQKIKFLTAGESHGKGLTGIIENLPAGLEISEEYINCQLARRQKGHGRGSRMKIENDQAEIISGVRYGKSLGSPIGLSIENRDWENWTNKMSIGPVDDPTAIITLPRPGHADLAGVQKFGFTDIRNVIERSSARETAMRVALGAICRKLLDEVGIQIGSRVLQIQNVKDCSAHPSNMSPNEISLQADKSPVRCLGSDSEVLMMRAIDSAHAEGDTVGGVFQVVTSELPVGLGSYTSWDKKLNARLASAIMSINAIKGVEIGSGFDAVDKTGSNFQDEIIYTDEKFTRTSNNAGGIEGGMSNGMPLIIQGMMKPIPTLRKPLKSADIHTREAADAHKERTDTCAVPAAAIVAESMVCLVLADALLEKFGGDSIEQLKDHIAASRI